MPRVHAEWVSVTLEMGRLINLIGHIWHAYFSEHTGMTECVSVFQKLQSNSQSKNTFNQNYPEERDKWNKRSHPIKTLENLGKNFKVTRQDLDIILRLYLLYFVCAPAGVYKTELPFSACAEVICSNHTFVSLLPPSFV